MIKTINIAGIELDNYTVRESIMHVERCMTESSFYSIEEVTMDTLMMAESNEAVRDALHSICHTVIAENGILDAVGQNSMQRQHEIENHVFFFEFMKRLVRNSKTVFLLGGTEEETQQFYEFLTEEFPRLEFAGIEALENCVEASDAVVNEINAATPDVIISIIHSPAQEEFLMENKDKLCANIWYGIGKYTPLNRKHHKLVDFFRMKSKIHALEKHVHEYREQEAKIK